MIIKMLITFDFNPDTNEYTPISKELVKEGSKGKSIPKPKVEESGEPKVVLESNKLVLNQAAADLMNVKWEDRVSINYAKVDGLLFPVIGKDEAFETKGGGNKVTKSLTISCRGAANDKLSKYGDTFTLTNLKDSDGIFVLIGNAERPKEPAPEEIEVPDEIEKTNIDLSLDVDIEKTEDVFEITEDTFKL